MQLRQAVASSLAMSTGLSRYSRSLFRRGDSRWHGDERSSPSWLSRVRGQFRGQSLDALIKLSWLDCLQEVFAGVSLSLLDVLN